MGYKNKDGKFYILRFINETPTLQKLRHNQLFVLLRLSFELNLEQQVLKLTFLLAT